MENFTKKRETQYENENERENFDEYIKDSNSVSPF